MASRRRAAHHNRATFIDTEDATHQAGWLFADSFLALMVVFLATISFVPALGGGFRGNANINVGNIAGANISHGLVFGYEGFDANRVLRDYQDFLTKQQLAPGTKVLYVNIVGGYNAATESANAGTVRALAFSVALRKAPQLAAFADARIDLNNSKLLKPNQVVLRVTLTP